MCVVRSIILCYCYCWHLLRLISFMCIIYLCISWYKIERRKNEIKLELISRREAVNSLNRFVWNICPHSISDWISIRIDSRFFFYAKSISMIELWQIILYFAHIAHTNTCGRAHKSGQIRISCFIDMILSFIAWCSASSKVGFVRLSLCSFKECRDTSKVYIVYKYFLHSC